MLCGILLLLGFSMEVRGQFASLYGSTPESRITSLISLPGGDFLAGLEEVSGTTERSSLIRINSQGDTIWSIPLAEDELIIQDICAASDGGWAYVACKNSMGMVVRRFDADANLLWEFAESPTLENKLFNHLAETSDGGFILGGTQREGSDEDFLAVKLSAAGSFDWEAVVPDALNISDYGYTRHRIWPDVTGGTYSAFVGGNRFVVLDAFGNIIFSNETGFFLESAHMRPDPRGGYLVLGRASGDLVKLVRINGSGLAELAGSYLIPGGYARAIDIILADQGYYLITQSIGGRSYWHKLDYRYREFHQEEFQYLGESAHISCAETGAKGGMVIAGYTRPAFYEKALVISADKFGMTNFSKVVGKVFVDENDNGLIDPTEAVITGRLVKGSNEWASLTDNYGRFEIRDGAPYDPFQVDLAWESEFYAAPTLNIDFVGDEELIEQDIPLQVILSVDDLCLSAAVGLIRPGFDHTHTFSISNIGSTGIPDAQLRFVPDPITTLVSTGLPVAASSGDTLIFDLPFMVIGDTYTFTVTLNHPAGASYIGTTRSFFAEVTHGGNEASPDNNYRHYARGVTGSYDPNDKTAFPGNQESPSWVKLQDEQWMEYRIRFQNTGSDTAFTVVVQDLLEEGAYDFNSLHILETSHDYTAELEPGGMLSWTFDDILLVDSNTNEPESHGFILYRIKLDSEPGTYVDNDAAIYFDFNEPIITNEIGSVFDDCYDIGNTILTNDNGVVTIEWEDAPYSELYRLQMSPADLNGDSVFSTRDAFMSFEALDPSLVYELRINTQCDPAYSSPGVGPFLLSSWDGVCYPPTEMTAIPSLESLELGWNQPPDAVAYDLRWKTEDTDWSTLQLNEAEYSLLDLAHGATVFWAVRTRCGSGDVSDWSEEQRSGTKTHNFRAGPNPASEFIRIHSDSEDWDGRIVVYDGSGRNVITMEGSFLNGEEINISALRDGAYLISVEPSDAERSILRFTKTEN